MVGLLTMTGGASLVGIWVYWRRRDKVQVHQERRAELTWWQTAWQRLGDRVSPPRHGVPPRNPATSTPTPTADLSFASPSPTPDDSAASRYGLHTSALALAATTTARLCSPPLRVAGLPLLVYMGIPAARQAYDQLAEEGRPGQALAETVVLVVCLAGGYFWVGSLGFCLYYAGRSLLTEQRSGATVRQQEWLAPTMTHIRKEGALCTVPTAALQPGDQVILHSGEMAPIDGLITEGMAWLRPRALPAASGLRKSVGDKVAATEIVLVGQICVRVLPGA